MYGDWEEEVMVGSKRGAYDESRSVTSDTSRLSA